VKTTTVIQEELHLVGTPTIENYAISLKRAAIAIRDSSMPGLGEVHTIGISKTPEGAYILTIVGVDDSEDSEPPTP